LSPDPFSPSAQHFWIRIGMDRRQIRYLLELAVFQTTRIVIRCMPFRVAGCIADTLGWCIFRLCPRKLTRYQVARDNLNSAFGSSLSAGEADRIILGMWRHLFRMIVEIIQLPGQFRLFDCNQILDFKGRELCVRALCADRPVLMLGGHFGNWEISVSTFGHFGFPMGVVARPLDNPYLHRWFQRFRESSGNQMIMKHGAGSELVQVLEGNGMAALLCDQDAGRSGVFVDFFGRPASTFKSIGLLAMQYDALIVVGGAFRLPREQQRGARWVRFNLATQDVIDPREFDGPDALNQITQRYTTSLEELIRLAPEQYFWVHRRWKTPPGARRRRRPAA
jgi:Kdo2-lipid IVA lauroyltransferase/acyltransferase